MSNGTNLTKHHLSHFTGTDNWYRHVLNRNVLYTDGAKYVAEEGGAYWLLDTIAICQRHEKKVMVEGFQVWKLQVDTDHTALLTCEDGNDNIVYSQILEYTDFPLEEITLFFANSVIHLPSEY